MDYSSLFLALGAIVLAVYYYYLKSVDHFAKHGVPYTPLLSILTSLCTIFLRLQSMADLAQASYTKNPTAKYVGTFFMTSSAILLRDPELIKTVTIRNFDHFPDHWDYFDEVTDPLFGKNLFALRGDRWKEVRSLLSPAFTSSKMKSMFSLMSECGAEFVDTLASLPDHQVDLKDAFTRYTNDIIASCAFGFGVNSMKDRNNQFYLNGREATSFSVLFFLKFLLSRTLPRVTRRFDIQLIPKRVSGFFTDLIADIIRTREAEGISRPDMIQLMMENREKMHLTFEEMTAQAFTFFFGGFESTATLMCFAAHEIGVNPEIQARLHKEIEDVLERNNGTLSYEAVNSMAYLDAVINEALRMYPVNIVGDRRCTKSLELPPAKVGSKPFVVQPGTVVNIPIYGIQRDPQYFEEPDKFNPDRFIENGKEIGSSGAFIPFGLGPRMCIGNRFALLETKVLLFHLLARCELRPCEKTCVPMKLSRKSLNMMPEGGFWMEVHPRTDPAIRCS